MARLARVVAVDVPHHITQRGNAGREVFDSTADYLAYLGLLRERCELHHLSLLGYCLMPNHVHLVAIPRAADSLALALRQTHGRYAAYLNARQRASGHVWQGRYYSCPLDAGHLWAALRYTERNPVRAGMVTAPEDYRWSSAGAHCRGEGGDTLLDAHPWAECWTQAAWREFLGAAHCSAREQKEAEAIRKNTHTGRPLGSAAFVRELEGRLKRDLAPSRGGRSTRREPDPAQQVFSF